MNRSPTCAPFSVLKKREFFRWTSEPRKHDALMVLPYDPKRVEEAGRYFDETVRRIQAREFAVTKPPEPAICNECDLRLLCHAEGILPARDMDRAESNSEARPSRPLPSKTD